MDIVETKDGSKTLFNKSLDEHYHSIHGALQESLHVFIKEGLNFFLTKFPNTKQLNLFEMGFGTGLNAMLTLLETEKQQLQINYVCIEAFPLKWETVQALHYFEDNRFKTLHTANWNKPTAITNNFSITKVDKRLENVSEDYLTKPLSSSTNQTFNLVYFDAFAPSAQPNLWELPVLTKMYSLLSNNGVFVTYCAKGQFKRNLKQLGFKVEGIPGPPGKREMTRALK